MIKIMYIYMVLLVFSCAYQGSPSGGPKDIINPQLTNIFPPNESQLGSDSEIVIVFDENIKLNSFINPISIHPEVDIVSKVRKNKLFIKPVSNWPNDLIKININRGISDLHSNYINKNIQLVYNLSDNNYCTISGNLENYSDDSIYNIFVYDWPFDPFSKPLETIDSDSNYNFKINYLNYGEYVVIASSGNLDIYNYHYGVNTQDYIQLSQSSCNEYISIYIDEPLDKVKVSRVEPISSNVVNIYYDDNTVDSKLIESNISELGDTVYINLKKQNRLHDYNLDSYQYIAKIKLDTIAPYILHVDNMDSKTVMKFSEPIDYNLLLINGNYDDEWNEISYNKISLNSIEIEDVGFSKIKVFGSKVKDLSGNYMSDSVRVYDIINNTEFTNKGFNILSGEILSSLEQDIIVEARNISLNLYYRILTSDKTFVFDDLEPGKYVLRAYEKKNIIDPLIYYSGVLDPYSRAAKFSIYKDTVEVREFWDVKGINIEF